MACSSCSLLKHSIDIIMIYILWNINNYNVIYDLLLQTYMFYILNCHINNGMKPQKTDELWKLQWNHTKLFTRLANFLYNNEYLCSSTLHRNKHTHNRLWDTRVHACVRVVTSHIGYQDQVYRHSHQLPPDASETVCLQLFPHHFHVKTE